MVVAADFLEDPAFGIRDTGGGLAFAFMAAMTLAVIVGARFVIHAGKAAPRFADETFTFSDSLANEVSVNCVRMIPSSNA